MQIKGVNFERAGLGFKLDPREVQRANKRLQANVVRNVDCYRREMSRLMRQYPQTAEQFGDLSVPYSRINCDSSYSPNKPYPDTSNRSNRRSYLPQNVYGVEISFRPSVKLTMELIRALVDGANYATGLGFNPTRDFRFSVTPSGLIYFKEPWTYWEKAVHEPEQHIVRIKFFGMPNSVQIDKLHEMADDVHLPRIKRYSGRDYFDTEYMEATFGAFSEGSSYPVVSVDKLFSGSFTRESENAVSDFYSQTRDFVLETGMTKNCVGVNGEPLSADTDVEKDVASASLKERGKYAPKIGISMTKPEIIGHGYGNYTMIVRSYRDFR